MAGITQQIPSYIYGMSEQPDELKIPGQVRDAKNVLPDVTDGLLKRPGGRLIQPLTGDKDGKWFHIYRDELEMYVCRCSSDGVIQVWNAIDGLPRPVYYTDEVANKYPVIEDTPAQGNAAYLSCDTAAFSASITSLSIANADVDDKRAQIDRKTTELEISQAVDNSPVQLSQVNDLGGGRYQVIQGYIDYASRTDVNRGKPGNTDKIKYKVGDRILRVSV